MLKVLKIAEHKMFQEKVEGFVQIQQVLAVGEARRDKEYTGVLGIILVTLS